MNKSKQGGVFTVEFALASFILFIVSFGAFELCRYIYLVNLTNAAISESTRDTKVHWHYGEEGNVNYNNRLEKMFKQQGQLWRYLAIDPEQFQLKICYFESYNDLKNEQSICSDSADKSVFAQYTLTYQYRPLMALTEIGEHKITRQILAVQEHQGWEAL